MNAIDLLNKKSKTEIIDKKDKKVNEVRSDFQEKNGLVNKRIYECRVCGGKKTIQSEKQKRTADETMTLSITCLNCKNIWKC